MKFLLMDELNQLEVSQYRVFGFAVASGVIGAIAQNIVSDLSVRHHVFRRGFFHMAAHCRDSRVIEINKSENGTI